MNTVEVKYLQLMFEIGKKFGLKPSGWAHRIRSWEFGDTKVHEVWFNDDEISARLKCVDRIVATEGECSISLDLEMTPLLFGAADVKESVTEFLDDTNDLNEFQCMAFARKVDQARCYLLGQLKEAA